MKLCPKCQKQFSSDANFCPVDAARLIPLDSQPAAAGTDSLTTRFELGDRLGGSRTGAVHRAKDKQTGATVAVKLVSPAVVGLPGVAQRLERELKQLERVQSAGVARLVASGRRAAASGEETWVAVELLDGAQTLAEAIGARGPIPLDQAAHLVEVIGEALIEAAQVGVVHRDLAPKNVLFAGGDIKLINFSLPVPTSDKVPGVPEFVAPEQVEGKAVDQRSNLYSLGAMYYYVLTGQTVFAGAADEVHRAHVEGAIRTPSSLAPVPSNVEAVIMRALDRSPTKRFLTVRQFVDEVTRIARGESDAKSTQPMGKVGAGRPKADLVATLLGVNRGAAGNAPAMPASVAPAAPAAPILPVQSPAPAAVVVEPAFAPTHQPQNNPVGTSTMIGVSQGPVHDAVNAGLAAQPAPAAVVPAPAPMQLPVQPAPAPTPAMVADAAIDPPTTPLPVAQILAPAQAASPWSAPVAAPVAAAPAVAAPVVAAPVVAAPVVAAPVVAAPVVAAPVVAPQVTAAQPAGKGARAAGGKKDAFRETMWFKKGDLDAQAAVAAAEERARTGKDAANDKADSMPVEDRYKDDGSISRGDKEKYSLRTGATQMMSAVKEPTGASQSLGKVSEDALIGEMKGGRGKVFAALGVGLVLLIVILILFLR